MASLCSISPILFVTMFGILNTLFDSVGAQSIGHPKKHHCTYDFIATPGIALVDLVIETLYARTSQKCALYCLSNPQCRSFNYQDFTELCQLNSASRSCAPDHVVFNGTMQHFSPPKAVCWKEQCGSKHKPPSSKPETNSVYWGPVNSIKKTLHGANLSHKIGGEWKNNLNSLMSHSEFDIRLEGGDFPHEGRVEFKYKNQWGGICNDALDLRDADVICRQIGYKDGAISLGTTRGGSNFGGKREAGAVSFVMTDIECSGIENIIDECKYNLVNPGKCQHRENAGVVCASDKRNPIVVETGHALKG